MKVLPAPLIDALKDLLKAAIRRVTFYCFLGGAVAHLWADISYYPLWIFLFYIYFTALRIETEHDRLYKEVLATQQAAEKMLASIDKSYSSELRKVQ